MSKTLRVTLEFPLEDLDPDQRERLAVEANLDVEDQPSLEDASPHDIADLMVNIGSYDDFFAGSDLYLEMGEGTVVAANFVGELITGHHSPLPWTYHNIASSVNASGRHDWIEDADTNIVTEHIGHLDGPLIVEAVNKKS
ncbi:hypothetical protein [Kiloniella sp.]|uniref:hypothetical protein n=1 Tax=Kiloniella sp. TaxID=1938587 RepID=UPI003B013BEA